MARNENLKERSCRIVVKAEFIDLLVTAMIVFITFSRLRERYFYINFSWLNFLSCFFYWIFDRLCQIET